MSRLIAAITLMVAAAASLPAQDRFDFGRQDWCNQSRDWDRQPSHCVVREETLTGPASLDVDASANGGIRVRGWDRRETHLRARVGASARSDSRAREIVDAVRIETAGGRIRAEGPEMGNREYWYVSFELEVPRDARLRLDARNGGISIADFQGTADFRTVNGGITLRDVSGDIRGATTNGGLNVELSGSGWEGAGLDVETQNGGVRMTIPEGYSAELVTGTVNGGVRIDFPVTVQGDLRGFSRNISTRLGSGGARIRAITTNGGVTIRRALAR